MLAAAETMPNLFQREGVSARERALKPVIATNATAERIDVL